MSEHDASTNKESILKAATKLFAAHGFDKTGISAIATEAKVNSALIYYYFKSKQGLLDTIIDSFVVGANTMLLSVAESNYQFGSPEMIAQMEQYDTFLLANQDVLRIMMMESLKASTTVPPLFRLIDFAAPGLDEEAVVQKMNARGFGFDENTQQRKVTEFFTGIMPSVIYSLFREKWCAHFSLSPKELDNHFAKAVESTHDQHHRS